jgi:hypothetical protein
MPRGEVSEKNIMKEFIAETAREKEAIEYGRLSVLRDFDSVCQADVFMGFTEEEFAAVKKFFQFNKAVSGWDK